MTATFLSTTLAGLLLLSGTFPSLQGQNEVQFQLLLGKTPLLAGQEHVAVVRAEIAPGWHLYSMTPYPPGSIAPQPTTIKLAEGSVFQLSGAITQPRPQVSHDENFGIDTEYFEVQADFEIPLRVSPNTGAGDHELTLRVRYMACNDRLCLPPQTVTLTEMVPVMAFPAVARNPENRPPPPTAAAPLKPSETSVPSSEPEPAEGPGELAETPVAASAGPSPPPATTGREFPSGVFAYLWFAMLMGGLALLTPCVFPMIPITVSYFTKREVSRRRALGDAALYSLGIVLTFTVLGFLLTFLFGAGGINRVATSPLVNMAIASIFILFALSLFGVLEIKLPSSWLTALDRRSSSMGGPVGILLMALTFSLTSFTCTVPFVGTVMVAAARGDWIWSLLGVAAFATVFSAPFFLLALFPSFLKSLPRSGGWMNSLKITMGFLELAAAMKFLSNVDLVYQWELITRPVFITVWLAIALVTAIYLLGKFYFPHETPAQTVGAGRVLSATFFLAISFYLLRGLFGFPLGELDAFLPPRDYGETATFQPFGSSGSAANELAWQTDYQAALQLADRQDKPVFIDFTGYLCTNCRWMETNIFPRPEVEELFREYVLVRLYTDGPKPEHEANLQFEKERFGTNCRWMEANIFPRPEVEELFREYVLVRLYTDGPKPEHEANLQFEKERFGTIALPLYAIMTPGDEIIATFPGLTRNPEEFVDFLKSGLESRDLRAQK